MKRGLVASGAVPDTMGAMKMIDAQTMGQMYEMRMSAMAKDMRERSDDINETMLKGGA